MNEIKKIGILTSGGDCAGLNPVIRAVVHHATGNYGWQVLGISQATIGLMSTPPKVMHFASDKVDHLLTMGGTVLGTTNKGDPFAFPMADGTIRDRSADIIAGYYELELDALIGIGGDGSLAILRNLAQQGNLNLVGIPKTIDNDVGATEISIGFDTAVEIATEALDRLHFTASSHNRVMILEVMGRDAGHIALGSGIAGGADIILIPEIPYKIEKVCQKIIQRQQMDKHFCLVIVSEAVVSSSGDQLTQMMVDNQIRLGGIGNHLAREITKYTEAETRVTVLGHIQRGGIPSATDRVLASAFGVAAVDLIAEGKFDHMVAWQNNQIISVPIAEAIKTYRNVDPQSTLIKTARGLGICLGD
jgi:ATP-dependent phosphofructokinase / diphosphate-dependent phosphofructokinase